MSNEWVYLNGELISKNEARISPFDRGFLFGDGVFETMRAYDGRLFAFTRHVDRLFGSLEKLGIQIPESPDQLRAACVELVRQNKNLDCAIRITVSRGVVEGSLGLPRSVSPTRMIHCRHLALPKPAIYNDGAQAAIYSKSFQKSVEIAGVKSLNYLDNLIAKQQCRDENCHEILLLNKNGAVIEGASSNVFAVFDNIVYTPPIEVGALPGITRGFCIEIIKKERLPFREESFEVGALPRAVELMVTNSTAEIVPVTHVRGIIIGDGRPGPVYTLLAKKYRELVESHKSR